MVSVTQPCIQSTLQARILVGWGQTRSEGISQDLQGSSRNCRTSGDGLTSHKVRDAASTNVYWTLSGILPSDGNQLGPGERCREPRFRKRLLRGTRIGWISEMWRRR